jgi:hypothetical protein
MDPIKCDQETAAACVERLLQAWKRPVTLNTEAWAREMGNLFSGYSPEAVRRATTAAIHRFKMLPTVAHLHDLLEGEATHEEFVGRQNSGGRVVKPFAEHTDEEVIEALVYRLEHNIDWPVIESDRAKGLASVAVMRFLKIMDPKNTYHVLSFHRLRALGRLPVEAKLEY